LKNSNDRLSGSRVALAGLIVASAVYAGRQVARRRRRMDFAGKTVVISGGSRGLGLELARAFAAEGANLVLLARDENNLRRSAGQLEHFGSHVTPLICDVGDQDQVKQTIASILRQHRHIDVLVNNAGIIQVGPVENMTREDYEKSMRVHFWGPLNLMNEVIPAMRAASSGRIVNIASIGGRVAVPHLLPYVASKFALVGLSEGMRAELLKDGIFVTTVSPGLMRTGSHLNAYFKGQYKKEYALFALANASPLLSTGSPSAARKILEACRHGAAQITITPQAQFLRLAHGLFPSLVTNALGWVGRLLPEPATPATNVSQPGWNSKSSMAPAFLTRSADRAAHRNNEIAADGPPSSTAKL
jgi:NAD(P)-dependent dehydrogenase (short-subunit alcohol dehydrogenase family)